MFGAHLLSLILMIVFGFSDQAAQSWIAEQAGDLDVLLELPLEDLEVDAPAQEETTLIVNPFVGEKLYIDPQSSAAQAAETLRVTDPEGAAWVDKIAAQPKAKWFGDWYDDIQEAVDRSVTRMHADGALPVLVAYNIPERDCGNHSGSGTTSAEAYRVWIQDFAEGIGDRQAIVILEPDALAQDECLTVDEQTDRYALIKEAVVTLTSNSQTYVYLDAGHSAWVDAEDMATRLQAAGIAQAQGFALNVSNYHTTEENTEYGERLSSLVSGKHFVIDTGRNGNGSNGEWCNPEGRALGVPPTALTGHALVDAYFWVKGPGTSDGDCGGWPDGVSFWTERAIEMAKAARW